jgi:hypothetical protein
MGRYGREWLQDIVNAGWSGEPDEWDDPLFFDGDLLQTGKSHALVVSVKRGFYDWKYDVLFEGGIESVDECALRAWQPA